tara:strand:- start:949 stop:1170 length:222 start_codon:yes stop_codon:yes gene_type:complete
MNWKPIETAPMDGTHILGFYPKGSVVIEMSYKQGGWLVVFIDQHGCGSCCDDYEERPTHWMPLPKRPLIANKI